MQFCIETLDHSVKYAKHMEQPHPNDDLFCIYFSVHIYIYICISTLFSFGGVAFFFVLLGDGALVPYMQVMKEGLKRCCGVGK